MIEPYECDLGAALGYDWRSVSLAMAGGASVQPRVSTARLVLDGLLTLQGEEGGHGVRLETSLKIVGGRLGDGGGAEQAGGRHPDVETAEVVQDLVDENKSLVLLGDVEGVGNDFGVGPALVEPADERPVALTTCRFVTSYDLVRVTVTKRTVCVRLGFSSYRRWMRRRVLFECVSPAQHELRRRQERGSLTGQLLDDGLSCRLGGARNNTDEAILHPRELATWQRDLAPILSSESCVTSLPSAR
jgi:hypothetical protein